MNESLEILRQMINVESMYINHYGRNHREIDCNDYLVKLQAIYDSIVAIETAKPKQTKTKKEAAND
ncbi:MAG: hypothetical protein JHC33_04940 [Ignisphaera sp.]|nr:hypothetical protein [Ignisphaera sp.]